jgi:hypothetical protein
MPIHAIFTNTAAYGINRSERGSGRAWMPGNGLPRVYEKIDYASMGCGGRGGGNLAEFDILPFQRPFPSP